MGINAIIYTSPCTANFKDQTTLSRASRIVTFAIGVILVITGILFLSGAFGNSNFILGGACMAAGVIIATLGSCIRCMHAPKALHTEPTPSNGGGLSASIATPVIANNVQPVQAEPILSQLHNLLFACVGHLNQIQILLNQKGIPTDQVYNGTQLQNYLTRVLKRMPNPFEGPPQIDQLMAWKALVDIVEKAKYDLLTPHFPKLERAEFQCASNITDTLNPLNFGLAERFCACHLKDEAITHIKQLSQDHIKEAFFLRLANDYYREGDLANTVKMLKEIYHDTKTRRNPFSF